MREILFRAKRADNGEWVEGGLLPLDVRSSFVYISELYEVASTLPVRDLIEWNFYQVIPETVGQYTGLKDQKGKKIFEGDIVDGYYFSDEDGYGVVEWNDGAWEINGADVSVSFHENICGHEIEVIGNIHDNPELL